MLIILDPSKNALQNFHFLFFVISQHLLTFFRLLSQIVKLEYKNQTNQVF
jgi:hypothetical protein